MSGIVAVLHADGAPLEAGLLDRLTDALAFRGPDARGTWARGPVGLGHTLLAAGECAPRQGQPISLDGTVWLAADLRLDGRQGLAEALWPRASARLAGMTDAELLWHAYRRWGETCLERLLGDYAFVLWDAPRRTLLCGRDPFGVKLLYYAWTGAALVVSNTLGCVRRHPGVSDRLNEEAVADFLLTGINPQPATTVFADVQSLAPGHGLISRDGSPPQLRRAGFWPEEPPAPRFTECRETPDRFRALLEAGVEDRLRTRAVTVSLSGGLDSPMIAAVAKQRLAAQNRPAALEAITVVFERLFQDPERRFAGLAAAALGIPIRYLPADDLYSSWGWVPEVAAPEPMLQFPLGVSRPFGQAAAARSRVCLTGYDGDALLAFSLAALWRGRLARRQSGSLARELGWFLRERQLPRLGLRSAWRRWWRRWVGAGDAGYPPWMDRGLEARFDLRGRWRAWAAPPGQGASPRGPAYAFLTSPMWRTTLEEMDPGVTGLPLEYRHPLLDLRLVRFCLALPPLPWCQDKALFRHVMRDALPAPLLRRPKSPLAGDPFTAGAARGMILPLDMAPPSPELGAFVDVSRYRKALADFSRGGMAISDLAYPLVAAFSLDVWLRGATRRAPPA